VNIELRPLRRDDIPDWNRLLAAVEAVDDTGEHTNEADLAEELANPDLQVGRDVVGAYDGAELVGYFLVYARSSAGDFAKIHLQGGVRPDRRGKGIGQLLVERMIARADEAHQELHPRVPAKLMTAGRTDNAAQAELLGRFGLVPERWSFAMRADLATLSGTAPELPEGLLLRQYDNSLSAALFAAHNEAFTDHPNFTPWNQVMWKQWVTDSRNSRLDLTFVAVEATRPDRVVSYVQTAEFDAYFQATGRREAYVAKVGTLRPFRGRGLAGALLRHSLAAYRAAGLDESALDVDSENPTGALGVYERAGFRVERRFADYVLDRPAR
jgi:mycothiol synthase